MTKWGGGDLRKSPSLPHHHYRVLPSVFASPSLPATSSHHKTEMGDERKIQIKRSESKQGVRKLLGVESKKYDHDWAVFEVGLPRISSCVGITTKTAFYSMKPKSSTPS